MVIHEVERNEENGLPGVSPDNLGITVGGCSWAKNSRSYRQNENYNLSKITSFILIKAKIFNISLLTDLFKKAIIWLKLVSKKIMV